ncbi:MAG: ornithine decarboxylase [Candidatus Electronema aureum]|uniref:Ornithine decarboxylase n=1 Tax=Candidatus Electronema aureum TaxID=2005002 RepID=A0A521G0H3_9BACT|nr:MAG: ornithine decarboxylase [Candidatus Electronema aureum]
MSVILPNLPAASVRVSEIVNKLPEREQIESAAALHGTPVMLLDCDVIRSQYRALRQALPEAAAHFALKPLPHPAVVKTLLQEGANFDLATNGEVDLVRAAGVSGKRTIHTHPIKRDSDIRHALEYGCTVFVIDNFNELEKFSKYRDQAELLIRLSFRNADAYSDLSKKFGCSPDGALELIQQAYQLGIRIKGLSFHVGSQTADPQKYVTAIQTCGDVFRRVSELGLPKLSTLDIGGGFPVHYIDKVMSIGEFCVPIRQALAEFPESVDVISEPGRFIVAPAIISVASVMGQAERDGKTWYYLDDGLYGSYSGMIYDHAVYPVEALHTEGELYPSVLAGPTCDSIDVISEDIMLPKLKNGDLVIGRMMGAYTAASASEFNFFPKAKIVVLNEPSDLL